MSDEVGGRGGPDTCHDKKEFLSGVYNSSSRVTGIKRGREVEKSSKRGLRAIENDKGIHSWVTKKLVTLSIKTVREVREDDPDIEL